ncbi:MAG: hypothetical protein PHQ56_01815 [Dysgonamonadaceae bacterium]|jgi:hypothetical protein|nr:hypothetical protein [Dysgonamonadaceae bacterium]MDD3355760.1 hypothetical protein [Dysgonamonadaceae bacterium]
MEINKGIIIEKAGKIIDHFGTEALTVETLVQELNVSANELSHLIQKDEDIFLMLFHELEKELNQLVDEFAHKDLPPDIRLHGLFKRLYVLFKLKPYYLSIVFDDNLMVRDDRIEKSFSRIRNIAEIYLSQLIDEGKRVSTFKTKQSTRSLVEGILSSFRLLMMDEQLINAMIRKLVALGLEKD